MSASKSALDIAITNALALYREAIAQIDAAQRNLNRARENARHAWQLLGTLGYQGSEADALRATPEGDAP